MVNEILQEATLILEDKSLTIRSLTIKDLELVRSVENRSHRYPWRTEHIRSSLVQHFCWGLLSADRQLCAYAFLSHILDEVELLLFVVDLDRQRQGLGRFFLSYIIRAFAPRARNMFLEVRRSNSPAIALYESCGFNQVGIRPSYYPPAKGHGPLVKGRGPLVKGNGKREDALIYACELGLPGE